jgi:hypothetical protein
MLSNILIEKYKGRKQLGNHVNRWKDYVNLKGVIRDDVD